MHIPVLLQEIIAGLNIQPDDVVLDGTINGGGHARALAERLGERGVLIGIDLDSAALARAKARLAGVRPTVKLVHESFRHLDTVLGGAGIAAANKILLDLGFSSHQLEESGRGFSFQKDEPLLMTLSDTPTEDTLTAGKLVNTWEEGNIAQIISGFGEERFAKRIARAIVLARAEAPIQTTGQLAEIVARATPRGRGRIHPATKTFQALRIATNDELGALTEGLEKGFASLAPHGRMAVISFHSLEDRMVKQFWRKLKDERRAVLHTKKPIIATEAEISENPRSRSAKLRIIEKIT